MPRPPALSGTQRARSTFSVNRQTILLTLELGELPHSSVRQTINLWLRLSGVGVSVPGLVERLLMDEQFQTYAESTSKAAS